MTTPPSGTPPPASPPPPPPPPPPQGWQYPPAPPAGGAPPPGAPPGAPPYGYGSPPGASPGAPPYGYGPPPGWGFVAPNHATRLGYQSAGFGERLGAMILDSLILAAISLPIWIIGIWWVASNWEEEPGTCVSESGFRYACDVPTDATVGRLVLMLGLGFLFMLAVSLFYWGKFEGERGQTPGKKALGIRVLRQETGQPIGFGRAVGRLFARYLSSQVLCLGYLWMLWDDNKQTWHDKIVSSIVVKE